MATFIVLMGAPGAGKGTQAKLLEKTLGLPQVATGDLFRANLQNQTQLGAMAKSYMDKGELVPDKVTVAMVKDRLSQPDAVNGAILDGFPRTPPQADALDHLLMSAFAATIAVAPYIFVDTDVLVERLRKRSEIEGRTDDNEATIRNRMRVYREETEPLLHYYRARGLLVEIDGDRPIETVHAELIAVIEKAARK